MSAARWPPERELTALWPAGAGAGGGAAVAAAAGGARRPRRRAGRAGGALPCARRGAERGGRWRCTCAPPTSCGTATTGTGRTTGVLLHLVWEDDLDAPVRLAGGGRPPTAAVGPALRWRPEALRALLRRGPCPQREASCAAAARSRPPRETVALVRVQGRRRLAERVWRAARLVEREGPAGAWARLLGVCAARQRRSSSPFAAAGGGGPGAPRERRRRSRGVRSCSSARGRRPGALIEALRADGTLAAGELGAGRAGEGGMERGAAAAAAALAAAHDDVELARGTAALADAWPAPRPYGRTRALEAQLLAGRPRPRRAGALWAQGLLHLQELWCERGGCGACPLSSDDPQPEPGLDHGRPA